MQESAPPPSWVTFCTQTAKICYYCHLLLHCATTTAAQMAAPALKIVDTTSYTSEICLYYFLFIAETLIKLQESKRVRFTAVRYCRQ
jgi:hypothetical protein